MGQHIPKQRKVKATCIENIFDPHKSQKILEFDYGLSIGEIITSFNPVLSSDLEIVLAIDGYVFENETNEELAAIVPKEGSSVVFSVAVPKGGSRGGGKNPLKMVALLAVSVLASYAAAPLAAGLLTGNMSATAVTAWGTGALLKAAVGFALTTVGGMLVNAVFGGTISDVGSVTSGLDNVTSTPTYGWEAEPNVQEQGVVVPVLYGRHRITPPIINSFITTADDNQTYNALYCIADHPIDYIGDEYLNDNPITNYDDVTTSYRYGELNQGIIPAFADTYSDKSVGFKLDTDWSTTETSGNAVEGLVVGISIPGLYYANDSGGLDSTSVTLNMQYRVKGEVDWVDFFNPNDIYTATTLSEERWSAGYYSGSKWIELEAGTTTITDHTEGERYSSNEGSSYWRYLYITYRTIVSQIPNPNTADENNPYITVTSQETVYPTIYTHTVVDNTSFTITEATQDEIRRTFTAYNLTANKYEVRVRLETAPTTGVRYRNSVYFSYIQEVVFDDFTYPGTALLGLEALATDQLSGSRPRMTCVAERTYVDVWTGSAYEQKPANNPAWVCYDMLHNSIYGGNQSVEKFIYEDFEEWADYCVDKGYECNIYIDAASNLSEIMSAIATLGRAAIVFKGSQYGVIIDKVEPMAVQHFMYTKGNMLEDSYANEFLDLSERANAIEVTYFDKDLEYTRQIVELYQNDFDSADTVVNKTSVTLVGCVDRTQAINYGRACLLRNRYLTQTISFEAGIDSIACLPGQVIEVSSDIPQWGISSGRIISATSNTVTLPEEVELIGGESYAVQVKLNADDSVETKNVIPVSITTTATTLNLQSAWTTTPSEYDLYAFGKIDNVTKKFRVISITRANDTLNRKISALEYIPEIYADTVDTLSEVIVGETQFVTNLDAREVWVFATDGTGKSVIDITWRGYALSWNVYLKRNGGIWELVGQATKPNFRVDRSFVKDENYTISVTPYDSPDLSNIKSITIMGKDAPPSDILNFKAVTSGGNIILTWDQIPDIDFLEYKIYEGVDYNRGNLVAEGVTDNRYVWSPPISASYTFWIKAIDRTEHESENAASTSVTIDLTNVLNVVVDREEIPSYVGAATLFNLWYDSSDDTVKWIPGSTFNELTSFTFADEPVYSYLAFDFSNGIYTSAIIDTGAISEFTLRQRVEKTATLTAPSFGDFIYGRTFNTFTLDTFISVSSLAKYVLYYRYSDDDVTYSDWETWKNIVTLNTRYIQIRVTTDIQITSTSFEFTSINTVLDVDEKIKKVYNQTISSSGTNFTLSSIPIEIVFNYNVGVTVLGAGFAAWTVDIQSDNFTVYIYDAAGVGIERDVNLEIVGF